MDTMTHYPHDCKEENMVHAVDHHGEYHQGKEHKRTRKTDLAWRNNDL